MTFRVKAVEELPPGVQAPARRALEDWVGRPASVPVVIAKPIEQPKEKPRKYRNQPVVIDGERFDSKLESRRYLELMNLYALGQVLWFQRQPIFRLAPGIKYRADFMVAWSTGEVSIEDCKSSGTRTPVYVMKKKLMAERWPKIEIWEIESVPAGMPHATPLRGEP